MGKLGSALLVSLTTLASWGLLGCDAGVAPGSFEVRFVWADGPPPEEPALFVFARIEGPAGASAAGQTLGTAGPEPYQAGLSLDFPPIANGAGRVVVVELKDAPGSLGQVKYYGVSQPFAIEPGVVTRVDVRVQLRGVVGEEPAAPAGEETETEGRFGITVALPGQSCADALALVDQEVERRVSGSEARL